MANKHELENLMRSTMENLRDMIDVNTVVGDVVELQDGGCIIPISKVTLGFAAGGSEFGEKDSTTEESGYPFGGGSGAGVSVKPVAFLVIKDDFVRLLNVDHDSTMDKLVDYIPQIFDFVKSYNKDCEKENKNYLHHCLHINQEKVIPLMIVNQIVLRIHLWFHII